jgi:hypothetical protein
MTNAIRYRSVIVPAYSDFAAETLIEGTCGDLTSGLCRTIEEAQTRILALVKGEQLKTQAPDYQANEAEMQRALINVRTYGIRDGGLCRAAVEAAVEAGIHTVEWAIASRYLVAGWC